jgi:hypothetical protein
MPHHGPDRVHVDEVPGVLVELLRGRPLAELVAFRQVQDELFDREAHRWDLWAAAYVINGGASDDGFEYFLGWLMAQGRARWESTSTLRTRHGCVACCPA